MKEGFYFAKREEALKFIFAVWCEGFPLHRGNPKDVCLRIVKVRGYSLWRIRELCYEGSSLVSKRWVNAADVSRFQMWQVKRAAGKSFHD